MSTTDLATLEDELYGLPLQEFTPARDARASEARQTGDRDLATSVKQMRKPSAAAWLANMLVRERGTEIKRLIDLGETLRSSRTLKGEQIREATQKKADSVRRLLGHAQAIADRARQPVSQAVLQDLEVTLDAAFSDAESAALLRGGHLTSTLRYSGLGFAGGGAPRSAKATTPSRGGDSQPAGTTSSVARKALEEAVRQAARADAEAERAKRAVVTAEADLKRLRAALAVADRNANKARQKASAAQRKVDASKSANP